MNQPVVYADVTFLVNFIMDYIILWSTSKLTGRKTDYWRFAGMAILGGIYGVGNLFPHLNGLYSWPAKIVVSLAIVMLAFPPRGWPDFSKTLLAFFGVSFVAAGATVALGFQFNQAVGDRGGALWWLLGGILGAVVVGYQGEKYLARKLIPALLKHQVELHFGHKVCRGKGFLDTGNHLRDPLTHRPVVVAEYELLKNCIPRDCQAIMENNGDQNDVLEALSSSSWANRLRLIPFTSIGQKNGMMVGFRCDQVIIDSRLPSAIYKNLVVGIYLDRLTVEDDYQLLIPSEILQTA